MKFVLLSDLHLLWENPVARLDNAHETQMKKLEFIWDWADDNNASILVAGDFFDKPRSWYLLPEIISFLYGYTNVNVHSVFGQHDMYLYSENKKSTNLGVLIESGLVQEIGNNDLEFSSIDRNISSICLHGANWGEQLSIPESTGLNIGVIHAPIGLQQVKGVDGFVQDLKALNDNPDYDLILCGDIHQQFILQQNRPKKRIICNPGPLLRLDASEDSFKHKPSFFVYETNDKSIQLVEIPHEPADKVLTRSHLDKEQKIEKMLEQFTTAIQTGADSGASFFEILDSLLKSEQVSESVRNIISKLTLDK